MARKPLSAEFFMQRLAEDCSIPSKIKNFEVKLESDSHLIMDLVSSLQGRTAFVLHISWNPHQLLIFLGQFLGRIDEIDCW